MSTTSTVGTTSSGTNSIYSQLSGTSGSNTTQSAQETSDRFLKLLVAQMKNQDPLSPMDNAQVTSQMAQINTVSGIEKLNGSVTSLGSQLIQSQTLQGASLVGKGVLVEGSKLALDAGKGSGAFELAGAADSVKVEVLSSAGRVIDTVDLGTQTSGQHHFDWSAPASLADTTGLTFRVAATQGTAAVTSTALMRDAVQSISTSGSDLNLNLASGTTVAYGKVRAISE
ncbi:flagellar basal-body rod modification protein FlgD [Sphaerotilus hippei]|uniref:Basal-body rod modification protein FlgD n=1 Tax=Sphaerotilus hippei TaxID=744406 RepID=A0A318H084_9BURK|nr:flagellar hook capping FlgD N-terminal domain-containing protein [Sphaerotilus hippei]PXW93703.1 flagellar basal-body rod modification protein FlgD [Sphaerotilus hippei]